jgi:hypothetical protein
MADIAAVNLEGETLTAAPFAATASGGDSITVNKPNADLVIEFLNDAAGSVTPTIANQVPASLRSSDFGKVEKADLSVAVAAGATRCVRIPAKVLQYYLTSANKVNLTYASHDVAFKVRALSMEG